MSRLTSDPNATYPDVRFQVGERPDGSFHVLVYGMGDDITTTIADRLGDIIEARLNAYADLLEACIHLHDLIFAIGGHRDSGAWKIIDEGKAAIAKAKEGLT